MGQLKDTYQEKKENVLKEALNKGFVLFYYKKADGTTRTAIGTRNVNIVTKISSWKPTGAKENTGALCYFDLVRLAWRSMSYGSLIDIAVSEWGKSEYDAERYIISQSYAARRAINECMESGTFGNIPHLVDIMANNFVWQSNDELVLSGNAKQPAVCVCYRDKYEEVKRMYNELADDYSLLVDCHNEVVAENKKNVEVLKKMGKVLTDGSVYKTYPTLTHRPKHI